MKIQAARIGWGCSHAHVSILSASVAFKEQQTQIEQQQEQIKKQQQAMVQQQSPIDALKKLVCADHPQAAVCKQ